MLIADRHQQQLNHNRCKITQDITAQGRGLTYCDLPIGSACAPMPIGAPNNFVGQTTLAAPASLDSLKAQTGQEDLLSHPVNGHGSMQMSHSFNLRQFAS